MNLDMAVRAPGIKRALGFCCGAAGCSVSGVALEAEEWNPEGEQPIIDRTVGTVARGAVFGSVSMSKGKGSCLFHMTLGARLLIVPFFMDFA